MTKFTSFLSLAELAPEVRETIERYQKEINPEKPLQVVALCTELGITVLKGSERPENGEVYMDARCPLAVTGDQAKYTIIYNTDEALPYRRYAVAHALAHILLEGAELFRMVISAADAENGRVRLPKDMAGQEIYTENDAYRGGRPESVELAANQMAGMILMPLPQIDDYLKKSPDLGVRDLGKRFGVSPVLAAARMGIQLREY